MEKSSWELAPREKFTIIFLFLGSLMMMFGAIYLVEETSIFYGIGLGAAIQSIGDHVSLNASVAGAASQLQAIHTNILESYVLFLVTLFLLGGAFIMLLRRNERSTLSQVRYIPFHAVLVAVYVLLLYLIFSGAYSASDTLYLYITYAGIVICFACDIFLEFTRRLQPQTRGKPGMRRTMALNPSTPFSNIVSLKEEIFSNLSGHLRIVDKHFNSTALANLHRLLEDSRGNFTKVTVLTSAGMLDSDINSSVADFKSELAADNVAFELKLMDEKDAVEQHERLMLDDRIAYKMPPFNVINKKSEHITAISYDQANKRFNYLYGRAINLQNYMIKQAREENPNAPDGA